MFIGALNTETGLSIVATLSLVVYIVSIIYMFARKASHKKADSSIVIAGMVCCLVFIICALAKYNISENTYSNCNDFGGNGNYCYSCGQQLEELCLECSAGIKDYYSFCPDCGTEIRRNKNV